MQIPQGSLRPLITDLLYLTIIHHRGFHAGIKLRSFSSPSASWGSCNYPD